MNNIQDLYMQFNISPNEVISRSILKQKTQKNENRIECERA